MPIHNHERAELHQALKDFAASPRFHFLKLIQVGPLVGDDAKTLGTIADMTFEELVTAVDNHASDLHHLSDAQERLLTAVLRALAEGEVAEQPEPGFDTSDEAPEEVDEGSSHTTFNSVQCELELRERITHVKSHPDRARIDDVTVGTFWDPQLPRAPFEESLTVKQLLALDLGVLAKKRSMTSARMRALAVALERGLESLNGGQVAESSSNPPIDPSPVLPEVAVNQHPNLVDATSGAPFRHRWVGHFDTCSPTEMALVESVMYASSDDEGSADTIFGALHDFCAACSVSDFLTIMRGAPLATPVHRKLMAWTRSDSLREIVPLVRLALQGPGTHITRIAKILQGGSPASAVYGITATLLARGIGAQEVVVGDRVCRDLWTTNPGLVPLIASHVTSEQRASVAQALTAVCPDMDPFLHLWLQGIVSPAKRGKKGQRRR
jgi:hypothetical protein